MSEWTSSSGPQASSLPDRALNPTNAIMLAYSPSPSRIDTPCTPCHHVLRSTHTLLIIRTAFSFPWPVCMAALAVACVRVPGAYVERVQVQLCPDPAVDLDDDPSLKSAEDDMYAPPHLQALTYILQRITHRLLFLSTSPHPFAPCLPLPGPRCPPCRRCPPCTSPSWTSPSPCVP